MRNENFVCECGTLGLFRESAGPVILTWSWSGAKGERGYFRPLSRVSRTPSPRASHGAGGF